MIRNILVRKYLLSFPWRYLWKGISSRKENRAILPNKIGATVTAKDFAPLYTLNNEVKFLMRMKTSFWISSKNKTSIRYILKE